MRRSIRNINEPLGNEPLGNEPLGVLGFAVAERPILLADFDQIDQDVFSAQLQFLMESIRYRFVKALLGLESAASVEGDLQKDTVVRPLDVQVSVVELQTRPVMFGDHLKPIVLGDAERIHHRAIHDLSDSLAVFRAFAFE
jgi:hypothetical protein